ncbi:MAG: DUF2066 domain-containing protein [Gammaproteobacteria bacterium]|nr:DUF2066 domain-containing protein [Gammaproteobacteria bacterium]
MLFLPLMSPAYAARVPDLYQAEAQVSGEDPEQREPAFREALGKVLIKVTGSRSILTRGSLTGGLDDAASFVQQFRYRVDSLDDSGKEPHRSLWVSFDKALVDRFLAERRLPVWSENRPAVLVWLGVEARGKRQLFDPERNQPERTTVEAAAAERGLAMVFPIMDLEDQTQMQVADLWGSFESNIRLASQRYAPEQILTIRMVAAERGLWLGYWSLYDREGMPPQHWENRGGSLDAALADGVNRVADILAARFAPLREDRGLATVRLHVSGVDDLTQYAELASYLSGLGGLDSLALLSVEGGRVTYELRGGSAGAIAEDLDVGEVIESDSGAGPPATVGNTPTGMDLYYRLR